MRGEAASRVGSSADIITKEYKWESGRVNT
jgi:hypothetical protein